MMLASAGKSIRTASSSSMGLSSARVGQEMTPTRLSSIRASLVRCNDLSWLTFKKLNRQFHARLQESRREAEDGVGDLHLLEGVRAHEGARVPSLKRNSMLYRS